jgi:hypothetical protein
MVILDEEMSGICSIQVRSTILSCLWFSDEAHFQFEEFMNKQNKRFWASKNPHQVMELSLHHALCTMWCPISKQGFI